MIPSLLVARVLSFPSVSFLGNERTILIEETHTVDGPRSRVVCHATREDMMKRLTRIKDDFCESQHEHMEFTRRYLAPLEREIMLP